MLGKNIAEMKILKYKKSTIIPGFVLGIVCLLVSCHSSVEMNLQPLVDSIATKWVPDNREGICSVTSKNNEEGTVILKGETTIPQAKQEIINTLDKRGIALIDSILLLPDTTKGEKITGLVSLSVINLRKEPHHSSELVSQALLGTPVMILKDENGWFLIQTPDKYVSWTEKSSVKPMTSSEMNDWKKSDRVIYLENSGWIYASPDESGIVGDIVAGCILVRVNENKGYAKVVLPDGREGFIRNTKIKSFENWRTAMLCTGDDIIKVASTFLGLPYLWGGTSTKGVDCSGFSKSVYFLNGLILARDASLQSLHGIDVDISKGYSQLKKGDLLFFGSKVNSVPHVTHVAIYYGDSEYINSSGRVMINSLDSLRNNYIRYRESSLLSAKRIIGTDNDMGIISVAKHPWY
jgi:gamma-D-glutamyl-L-lysine dipeptidyl-peptidase